MFQCFENLNLNQDFPSDISTTENNGDQRTLFNVKCNNVWVQSKECKGGWVKTRRRKLGLQEMGDDQEVRTCNHAQVFSKQFWTIKSKTGLKEMIPA